MDEYVPISCVAHERLEFAVLRRQRLRLCLLDETGASQKLTVLPIDVNTRDHAEWLSYRDEAHEVGIVRLDRILSADPVP